MIPGEILTDGGDLPLNPGRATVTVVAKIRPRVEIACVRPAERSPAVGLTDGDFMNTIPDESESLVPGRGAHCLPPGRPKGGIRPRGGQRIDEVVSVGVHHSAPCTSPRKPNTRRAPA